MLSKRLKRLQRSLGDRVSDGTDLEALIRDNTAADHSAVMGHKRRAPSQARAQSEHALRALADEAEAEAPAEDSDSEEEPEAEHAGAIDRARKRGRAEAKAAARKQPAAAEAIDSDSDDSDEAPRRPAAKRQAPAPRGVPADISESSDDEGNIAPGDVQLSSRSVPRSRRTVGPSASRRSASRSRSRAPEAGSTRRRNRGARLE